jgi:hypothetical protein
LTHPANKSSPKSKKQPKTQRKKFAVRELQQLTALVVGFWSNRRMGFIIIEWIYGRTKIAHRIRLKKMQQNLYQPRVRDAF